MPEAFDFAVSGINHNHIYGQVDAMLAAGPTHDQFNPDLVPVLHLLRELGDRKTVHDLAVTKPGLHLSVRRRPEGSDRA